MIPIKSNKLQALEEDSGFTLLEVIMAMAIFSIGILAVFSLQTNAISGNARARGVTDISVCAADRVEKLMALPFNDADLTGGAHTPAQDDDGIDNDYDGFIDEANETGALSVQWNVTDDWPMLNVKTISVTVISALPYVSRTITLQSAIPLVL